MNRTQQARRKVLNPYKVLRAGIVQDESMTPFMGAFSFDPPRIRRDLKSTVKKMPRWDFGIKV